MIEALHRYVVPGLKARHFTGRFPDFRRISSTSVDLLSIHFARHAPAFAVEVSCAPLSGLTVVGKLVPAEELTAWHATASARFRIGPDGPDQWFSFKEPMFSISDPYKKVALAVIPYIENQAEVWWREASSITRSA